MVWVRREAVWEYLRGALWVLPTIAVVMALVVGYLLSQVEVSSTRWFVFQGTADDARTLLIAISSTLATVIALVLGLTVVALQLASTQFSPRLLRNFLRDRVNQVVLSAFVATFTYSTAGLFTVGVEAGQRVEDYPRLAVSFALVLLFVTLLMLVFFVHHLAHSIQIDEVMRRVERSTLRVIGHDLASEGVTAEPTALAATLGRRGAVVPVWLGPDDASGGCCDRWPRRRTWWPRCPPWWASTSWKEHRCCGCGPLPRTQGHRTRRPSARSLPVAVRVGFERTAEQDVAFGVRQLVDIAVKALSPAINDPYTAIQSLEHVGVLLAALVRRPLGNQRLYDDAGVLRVVAPGRDLDYYLDLATGQIRRYGCSEPRVDRALLRVLATTGGFCDNPEDRALLAAHVQLVVEDAERTIAQAADLAPVRAHADLVLRQLATTT